MESPRRRILKFFREAGCRMALSRPTLSCALQCAYPSLDLALEELVNIGTLERIGEESFRYSALSWQLLKDEMVEHAKQLAEDIAERERQQAVTEAERLAKLNAQMESRRLVGEERARARAESKKLRLAKIQSRIEREQRLRMREEREQHSILVKREQKQQAKIPVVIAELPPAPVAIVREPTDPWTIIRQRYYSKPPLLEGGMKQDPRLMMRSR